ncbi:hypothetical protein GOC90_27320 [Sinorhizobium medicae]|nr:hypothetical protein [Sinorhizobium medicae]
MRHGLVARSVTRAEQCPCIDRYEKIGSEPSAEECTEPVLVAEVENRAWTDDGRLRHASFKGIRERDDEVVIYSLEG